MMEQPNLIKRPVLVDGDTVIFGFDREAYDRLASNSARLTSGSGRSDG